MIGALGFYVKRNLPDKECELTCSIIDRRVGHDSVTGLCNETEKQCHWNQFDSDIDNLFMDCASVQCRLHCTVYVHCTFVQLFIQSSKLLPSCNVCHFATNITKIVRLQALHVMPWYQDLSNLNSYNKKIYTS